MSGEQRTEDGLFDHAVLTIEHGYICIRHENGWLFWSAKVNDVPSEGVPFDEIMKQVTKEAEYVRSAHSNG